MTSCAVVLVGGWLLVRRTRSYIWFKCLFQCHWDYRTVRRKARQLVEGGATADPVEIKALWDGAHNRCAQRGYECVAQQKGLWVKMSQMLATRSDILPEVYCRLLGRAQDQMPARPVAEVKAMIAAELGRPLEEVFSTVVAEPIGSASIAQVHRARLQSDGTEVIIKVQHAGIEQRMAADIIILRQLLEWLKKLEPDFDMTAIARQWMKAIPEELDFMHEAANMVEMARCLEASAPAQQRSAPIPFGLSLWPAPQDLLLRLVVACCAGRQERRRTRHGPLSRRSSRVSSATSATAGSSCKHSSPALR